jgi:hypothetical protein
VKKIFNINKITRGNMELFIMVSAIAFIVHAIVTPRKEEKKEEKKPIYTAKIDFYKEEDKS